MAYDFLAIDAVCNYEFDNSGTERPAWSKTFITDKIGADESSIGSFTAESFLAKMDRAGIEHAFLIAVKAGSAMHAIHRHISYETVAGMVRKHPKRFSGLAGVDPTEGMKGIAQLERAIKELGFVGAHLYPHWFEMAPDHARYYPIYSKCAELGVPNSDAGRTLPALFRTTAAAERGTSDYARHDRVPFSRTEADRHPHRLAVGGGNDFRRL